MSLPLLQLEVLHSLNNLKHYFPNIEICAGHLSIGFRDMILFNCHDRKVATCMDNRLISYLYFFNIKQDYYECHEYGEHLWLELGRPVILKGLIQAAVCLYHLHNGNVKGGYAMWQRAKKYIRTEGSIYEGIDLDALIHSIDCVFQKVPHQWYQSIISPKDIENLHLPTVHILIHHEDLNHLLPTWKPEPLDHAESDR